MFVPSRRELEKWDKVGQKSAFRLPAVTIFVTFVKDQGVTRMFTPSLRVYHTCQEVFLFRYSYSSSNCPGLQTRDHGSQKESRRRLAADRTENIFWAMPSRSAVGVRGSEIPTCCKTRNRARPMSVHRPFWRRLAADNGRPLSQPRRPWDSPWDK